jgi:hypothetical protein
LPLYETGEALASDESMLLEAVDSYLKWIDQQKEEADQTT